MTAVWLSDELMVTPGAVAGLRMRCEWFEDARQTAHQYWEVEVVWAGGSAMTTRRFDDDWYVDRELAEAEMERLSALLWPPPDPGMIFVPDEPMLRGSLLPDIRIFDPELYGLPACGVERSYAGVICRCDLAENHHLHGRPEHRFPDANP